MEITFLGTSCMVPTKDRNVSGIFLSYKTEGILLDCGEGTQRQMNITGIKRTKITKILISHWHGDHVSGIIGLLQTIANKEVKPIIEIYGPKGTKENMKHLLACFRFDLEIDLRINEVSGQGVKQFYENEDFVLEAAELKHNVATIGFSFVEKDRWKINSSYLNKMKVPDGPHLKKLQAGKSIVYKGEKIDVEKATILVPGRKITYIADTLPCTNAIKLAEESDILISEASYVSDLQDKATDNKHMTSKDAALLANKAHAKQLILTHFSQRYKNSLPLQEDAQTYFDNVVCAEDFMKIKL